MKSDQRAEFVSFMTRTCGAPVSIEHLRFVLRRGLAAVNPRLPTVAEKVCLLASHAVMDDAADPDTRHRVTVSLGS